MKRTNAQLSKLLIAIDPTQADDQNRNYQQICDSTSITLNVSYNKQDSTYFCNNGETTSTITGRTQSLSVSIDFDNSKEAHKYLKTLLISDAFAGNNQYVRLELQLDEDNSWTTLSGKSCIQFKSAPPSGSPTELVKIEFDIFPQDSAWVWGKK